MITPEEFAQSIKDKEQDYTKRRHSVSIIKSIIDDAKSFFNSLTEKIVSIKDGVFKVNVENQIELPKIQEIDGAVSIKEIKPLLIGLNEIIGKLEKVQSEVSKQSETLKKELKPIKQDNSDVVKAIKGIPETKIPEYPKPIEKIEVSNLNELKQSFMDLAKKFDIKIPETKIPAYPKEIKVSNLDELKKEPEEEMTGLDIIKNEIGEVTDIIEKYPSGNVISSGWSVGRVKIIDER